MSCSLLLINSPACSYVTRLSRYPIMNQGGSAHALEISKDVSGFGTTFLPALVMAWKAKEVVKAMVELLAHHVEDDCQGSSWLKQGFEQKKSLIMPSCSTSTEARSPKKSRLPWYAPTSIHAWYYTRSIVIPTEYASFTPFDSPKPSPHLASAMTDYMIPTTWIKSATP